jgi:hypothetical protein
MKPRRGLILKPRGALATLGDNKISRQRVVDIKILISRILQKEKEVKKTLAALITLCMVFACGCANNQAEKNFSHPNKDKITWKADLAQCQNKASMQTMDQGGAVRGMAMSNMTKKCMQDKGYLIKT